MGGKLVEKILNNLAVLKAQINAKHTQQLKLKLFESAVKRLGSFSNECMECEQQLLNLDEHIEKLKTKQGQLEKLEFKENELKLNTAISHLQKEHKLVTEGYYVGIYMSLGISLGVIFGLLLLENLALGLPIGLSIGLAIGSALDADAKKKGITI